jgi:hypothetical protein
MRLATVVSQAPGVSMASCCCRVCGCRVRLVHQLDDQVRREAVRLVQIPQVRLCQGPSGARAVAPVKLTLMSPL